MKEKKDIHIILVGPKTNIKANLIGGATISFGYLIDYFERHQLSHTLVNTKKYIFWRQRALSPVYTLLKVLLTAPKAEVLFLNSSRRGTRYLVPVFFVLCKLFRLKFVFRPFGGDLNEYTASYSPIQAWLFRRTTLRADILFLQTRELMQYYAPYKAHILQLPTSRNEPPAGLLRGRRPFGKRFVFLGFVNQAKGIDHILEARRQLGSAYTLHIYGPIFKEEYREKLKACGDVYQGVLKRKEVLARLSEYDVLMLPSYYEGEGYPGAIIEAYSLGLPVIATRWKAIPEILTHCQTGLLIEPRSTAALVEAIRHFNEDNYPQYAQRARHYFREHFHSEKVISRALAQIHKLF